MRRSAILSLFILLSVGLSGCAYRRMWLPGDGGYSDKQIALETFEVVFRGPAYFSHGRCMDYALLRAAEITLEHQRTRFEILSSKSEDYESTVGSTSNVEFKSDGRGGYTAEQTFDPMGTYAISLPTVRINVRLNTLGRGYPAQTIRDRVRATM